MRVRVVVLRWLVLPLAILPIAACGGTEGKVDSAEAVPTSAATPQTTDVYPQPPLPVTPPCISAPGSTAELGSPSVTEPARFRTDGSVLYLTARSFEHGGVFDPEVGRTAMYIGPTSATPDPQPNGYVKGATHSLSVDEKTYGSLQLPAGEYWLTSSQGGDVIVIACSVGAVQRLPSSG